MRQSGFARARLLQGLEPGRGRVASPDELDRSQENCLACRMDAYLAWLAVKGQSPRTIETRRRGLVLFIRWCQKEGLALPRQITRTILQGYQLHLWDHRTRSGRHLAAGSQIGRLTAVRGLFRWLCRQGLLDHDPSALLDLPREERRLPANTLSEAEVIAILRVPDIHDLLGVRNRAMLEVLYSTGIRRIELARLELRDVHRQRQTLYVLGKGGKDRVVPLGRPALAWMERYLQVVRPLLCFQPEEQALFLTGYGHGFSTGSLGGLIKQMIHQAHPHRTGGCHLLRHACATHMLEHGADVRVIQKLLGHAKLETTQIYTEVSIKLLQQVHRRTHPACREKSFPEGPATGKRQVSHATDPPALPLHPCAPGCADQLLGQDGLP